MGMVMKNEGSISTDNWLCRSVYFFAQKLIFVRCNKGRRAFPPALALNMLKWIANRGFIPAKVQLGQFLFELGVAKADKRNGLEYLRQAAKVDEPNAQFILGRSFMMGCDVVSQDLKQAAHWLALAADSGHAEAQQFLEIIRQNDARMHAKTSLVGAQASSKVAQDVVPA